MAAHRGGLPEPEHLTTDAQALNQVLVSFRIPALQIFQKTPAARHHRQQSPAGMMVLAMGSEMIHQLHNTLAEDRNLTFWRTRVGFVNSILRNYMLLGLGRQCHSRIDTPRLSLISFCTVIRIAHRTAAQNIGSVGHLTVPTARPSPS